jgi:hypothetical protein
MKRSINNIIILILVIFLLVGVSLVIIEQKIEGNVHNICVYNFTNDNIDIIINNQKITVDGKTYLFDKIIEKNKIYSDKSFSNIDFIIYNYIFEINRKNIFEKEVLFPSDECSSYSASGGTFVRIIINYDKNKGYDITFIRNDADEPTVNEIKELKIKRNKRIIDLFNKDGLNMN